MKKKSNNEPLTLKLTIARKWFNILGYPKDEEYREIKPYYVSRLMNAAQAFADLPKEDKDEAGAAAYKRYKEDVVHDLLQFPDKIEEVLQANGIKFKDFEYVKFYCGRHYGNDLDYKIFEFDEIECTTGRTDWGALPGQRYFVINLGDKVAEKIK